VLTIVGVRNTHPRRPTRVETLLIIDDVSRTDGNATTSEIRFRLGLAFGWHTEPTQAQLDEVLAVLQADGLVVKDGAREHGGHYALTPKGKRKLARLRQQSARPLAA
jgi:DNA-binding PadR family transcriptional regulator